MNRARSAAEHAAELEAALAAERAALAALTVERDTLRLAYGNAQQELKLMRRRLFVATAERLDTTQLELEFAHKLAALDALNQQLGAPATGDSAAATDADDDVGAHRERITFQPFRAAAASVTMLATSTGSTRSSEMRGSAPYSAARASRSPVPFPRANTRA